MRCMPGSTRRSGDTLREALGDTLSCRSGDGERDRGGLAERKQAISLRTGFVIVPENVRLRCARALEDFCMMIVRLSTCSIVIEI